MDAGCRIELLGGLRVHRANQSIERLRAQKPGSLLAYLAYFQGRAHPRENLIEIHWPELDPRAARNNLSVALSSLRRLLEPPGVPAGAVLRADREAVGLNSACVVTDVQEFRAALQAAARCADVREITYLGEAARLYRGPLLEGCFEEWLLPEQRELSEQILGAWARLADLWERAGNPRLAREYASRIVTVDPLREEAYLGVMRLHGELGEPESGLRIFRDLQRVFAEELRQAPSPRAEALAQQLREQAESQFKRLAVPMGDPRAEAAAGEDNAPPTPAPTGTVTLLFIDPGAALEHHRELLRPLLLRHDGHRVSSPGAHVIAAFDHATAALACARECRHALLTDARAQTGTPAVRMALHSGEVERASGGRQGYQGRTREHGIRLLAAGHGGQILCSHTTAVLARGSLPSGVCLRDLGLFCLGEPREPERLYQVDDPNEPQESFPPPEGVAGYSVSASPV